MFVCSYVRIFVVPKIVVAPVESSPFIVLKQVAALITLIPFLTIIPPFYYPPYYYPPSLLPPLTITPLTIIPLTITPPHYYPLSLLSPLLLPPLTITPPHYYPPLLLPPPPRYVRAIVVIRSSVWSPSRTLVASVRQHSRHFC